MTWDEILKPEYAKPYYRDLYNFVEQQYQQHTVYPPKHLIMNATALTPYDNVKCVIIGQDPYHGPNQAMGLCFAVPDGVPIPPSLANIYQELQNEFGYEIPNNGDLSKWAKEGVLLLNAVLTVQAGCPASHQGKGWETFTDTIIKAYIKQHNIRPVHHGEPMEDTASIDLVCPFLNDKGVVMSCTIYPVRPVICRIYKCDQTDEETAEKLDEEFKKGTVTLTDMSHEINVGSTFFPEEYLPKQGDPVIINQLHMLEYIKHENNIFLMTNQKRFKNGKQEVFIQHIDDPKQNLWFDIQGLTKVEIFESKKEANP